MRQSSFVSQHAFRLLIRRPMVREYPIASHAQEVACPASGACSSCGYIILPKKLGTKKTGTKLGTDGTLTNLHSFEKTGDVPSVPGFPVPGFSVPVFRCRLNL